VPNIERVIVVYDFGNVNGGAAQVAINSALELRRRGKIVDYFCAVGPISQQLIEADVNVICLGQADILSSESRFSAAVSGIWNIEAASRLASTLCDANRDVTVVHVHGWTKALSVSIFPVIKRMGFRVVVTAHDYFLACPNGGFFNYQNSQLCNLKPLSLSCLSTSCDVRNYSHKVWRYVRQTVGAHTASGPLALRNLIYISELSRSILSPHVSPDVNWHFVPNPIIGEMRPRVCAEDNSNYVFLGRLSKEKGGEDFCSAITRLGLRGVVVGDGPQLGELQNRWPAINFMGWQDRSKVDIVMSEARVLVFCSLWYETQGLVVQEAISRGVPALVADHTAARESISDGISGMLYSSGESGALDRGLVALQDNILVERLSRSGYSIYWNSPPTLESHVNALLEVYASVELS
jgi:glycosyltransferase involved in cell wall biosynthesis